MGDTLKSRVSTVIVTARPALTEDENGRTAFDQMIGAVRQEAQLKLPSRFTNADQRPLSL